MLASPNMAGGFYLILMYHIKMTRFFMRGQLQPYPAAQLFELQAASTGGANI